MTSGAAKNAERRREKAAQSTCKTRRTATRRGKKGVNVQVLFYA